MSNIEYYEFVIGAAGVFLILVIVQIIFARARKKNLKTFDYWYEIYQKEESEEEFLEIYAANRPPKTEEDEESTSEAPVQKAHLRLGNRKLEITNESKADKAKKKKQAKGGPDDKRDSPMIQPHKR